ncbi:hypothetical protein TNCV_3628461 [Trichonephila clavipes]|nr:hypothetical protein TNCV_3628461 [Trichonephila clavipes]
MDRLKFKLEIVEPLSASPPTKKSILDDDEDNSVVIPLAKKDRSVIITCYTCHGFYPGHSRIKCLTCIAIFDVLITFQSLASADLSTTKVVGKHVVKNAMVIYTCQKQKQKSFAVNK